MEREDFIQEFVNEIPTIWGKLNFKDITQAVISIYESWSSERTIYLCGNGGSASTASHFTCDLTKLGIKAHCLNDNPAIITAITNDNGFDNLYIEQIKNNIQAGDVLICFSVHGGSGKDKASLWSQNLVKAINYSKQRNAKTIGIVGFDGGLIKEIADISIVVKSNSTPHVESWHLYISHLICDTLKQYLPVKVCLECQRIYPVNLLDCPECHDNNYTLTKGIIGNIEELRKQI